MPDQPDNPLSSPFPNEDFTWKDVPPGSCSVSNLYLVRNNRSGRAMKKEPKPSKKSLAEEYSKGEEG